MAGNSNAKNLVLGTFYGLAAAAMWALYMTYATVYFSKGLGVADFTFIRFATTFAIFAPIVLIKGIGKKRDGVGFKKGIALTLCAGPFFILFATGGYAYAPLSYGAVIQPSTAAIGGLLLAMVFLGERPKLPHYIGSALIIISVILISSLKSSSNSEGYNQLWRGCLMFMGAGGLWSLYTLLIKKWAISGWDATKYISIICGLYIPFGLYFTDSIQRLQQLDFLSLFTLIMVFGVMWGVMALLFFSKAIEHLGVARAANFPSIVPAAAIFLAIPVAGTFPTGFEIICSLITSLGLIFMMGGFNRLFEISSKKRSKG